MEIISDRSYTGCADGNPSMPSLQSHPRWPPDCAWPFLINFIKPKCAIWDSLLSLSIYTYKVFNAAMLWKVPSSISSMEFMCKSLPNTQIIMNLALNIGIHIYFGCWPSHFIYTGTLFYSNGRTLVIKNNILFTTTWLWHFISQVLTRFSNWSCQQKLQSQA